MTKPTYVVATLRRWNIQAFKERIRHLPGRWVLITHPRDLTVPFLSSLRPRYVFFPHWSTLVPAEIVRRFECVCFHETDVPYGRGGSPLQNLIARGRKDTKISALRMTERLDAGPVYLKRPLSLEGRAEEIYIRASRIVADMIAHIVRTNPRPAPQRGRATVFKRRTPDQSRIPKDLRSLEALFDHLRMLDADEYPRAFVDYGPFRMEFARPALRTDTIAADVRISLGPKRKKS
jgi:methionyl-tRNA formyltransferase